MDFNDSPEQAKFRLEVQNWLSKNAELKPVGEMLDQRTPEETYDAAKVWYKKKFDAGYACITWPKEDGGAGLSSLENVIWSEEVAKYDEPDFFFVIGQGNCGPAIQAFSSPEEKKKLLPRMASAEDVWCQLFSEPSAGSDVAGLRTKAIKEGNNWIINGQKIWTSGAHYSDYGVILTRTDPSVSKYKGMTLFMIDMHQSGVEVKPIKQMNGDGNFNEVFFNDAIIPDRYRLGEIGGGWGASLNILMNERLAIMGIAPNGFQEFRQFCETASIDGKPLIEDSLVRDKLAEWYAKDAGLRNANARMLTAVAKGGVPGAEASLGKLVGASMHQDIANFTLSLMGQGGVVADIGLADMKAHFQKAVMLSPGLRLAGGTDEVMRNILAEQVLDLPQEPRADKGIPFSDIPTGNS
jgi:alkylation response protein AidB-like acyl-CoA dehydrogenase